MPITINQLKQSALLESKQRIVTLNEAIAANRPTAFLCHSHKDKELVLGLQWLLSKAGWNVYLDWQDNEMPDTPDKETASRIKSKIISLSWFLFLATPNSTQSRWCPWEIGYADAKKGYEKIFIIPTTDDTGKYYGNEYLQLYRSIDLTSVGSLLAVFRPGKDRLFESYLSDI